MTVELPRGPARFVNREGEKARAAQAVRAGVGRNRSVVLGLSGPVAVGKRELAYEIGRSLYEDGGFPHVFCVDLDEHRVGGAVDVGDVLTQLLESMGVEADSVKRSFGARRRQYRVKSSQTRAVLVVDNARYGSEVADLLPTSESVVLVTSHRPLYDLDGGAGVDVPVAPLEDAAARELLAEIVGPGRLAGDPEAAEALLRLCAGSPAALQVAGCTVRSHGLRPLARLLDEVRSEVDAKVAPVAERVLDPAYGELSEPAALLYRVLAVHPGPSFTRASATALLGLGADACDTALEELDRAGLVDVRSAAADRGARLRMPPAHRAHARARARTEAGGEDQLARALERLLRWYARQQQLADLFLAGPRLVVAERIAPIGQAPDVALADPEQAGTDEERRVRLRQAARWQYDERHTLFAAVRAAHAREWDALVVALCEPAWTYALDHPPKADLVEVFRLGLDSALRAGDTRGIVRMKCQLARWLWESGDTDLAAAELDGATAAVALLGTGGLDTKLRASTVEFRGMLDAVLGDQASAAVRFAASRDLHASISNDYGVMLQTYRLGQTQAELGDTEAAAASLARAHTSAIALGRERMTARTGFALAHVLRAKGRLAEAARLYQESLDSARRRGSDVDRTRVLDALAELAAQEGRSADAAQHRAAAAEIRRRNGLEEEQDPRTGQNPDPGRDQGRGQDPNPERNPG